MLYHFLFASFDFYAIAWFHSRAILMNITLCEMVNTKQVGWRKKTKLNTKKQLKPVEKVKTSAVFIFPEPK